MKAMVLAAGLGTGLRPLSYEIPKPMVPVLGRPLMAHTVELCRRQGFDELIANLHYLAETINGYFGNSLEFRYEEELLGTAGGVRNARDFFGDDPIVVVSGDVLTDIDLNELVARHRSTGGIATLAAKRVEDTAAHGVVLHGADGRVSGFQEKPHPDEALSDLADCGIYCFEPAVFDYFPNTGPVDWVDDVFPALLENDVPFHVHEIDAYWNEIGSPAALRAGTFDVLAGQVDIEVPESAPPPANAEVAGDVWIGANCRLGAGARLLGPVVIGGGATIGNGVSLRESIVLPGTDVPDDQILIGAIYGQR
jgi:mannose-1-phosphate guanylyltransferase